jgi:MFS family permease
MRAYAALMHIAGVPRLVAASVVGRLSGTMLGVTLALAVIHAGGTVAQASWALTAHAVSLASLAPVGGRLVDRFGGRRTMAGYVLVNSVVSLVLIYLVVAPGAIGLLPMGAALAGASNPPTNAVLRGQWPEVVPEGQLHTAYALDSVSNSAMFVIGPPFAAVVSAGAGPVSALAVAMLAKVCGDLILISAAGVEERTPPPASRSWGALRMRQVRLLLAIAALDTFTYGAVEVLTVAHGADVVAVVAGLLLGIFALGEVLGGLTYGARRWRGSREAHLAVLHVGTAAVGVVFGLAHAIVAVAVALLVAGGLGGARDTINQLLLSDAAASSGRTEAFAWLTTAMWGGFAFGTAAAGAAHDVGGIPGIAGLAVGASIVATVVTLRSATSPVPTAHRGRGRDPARGTTP